MLSLCLLAAFTVCLGATAQAQDGIRVPLITAPPPMKFVSRDERTQLATARDPKARLRATLGMAEMRLARAEELTAGLHFDAASAELGGYQGLIEDALKYLRDIKEGSNKLRDVYKRLEMSLRTHCARIESIRRTTPSEYAVNIKVIGEYTRTARTDALNAFYGDTVVREAALEDEKTPGGAGAKDSSPDSAKRP
jgi:hypothetical protein